MANDEFVPVAGHWGYSISKEGQVKSNKLNRLLSPKLICWSIASGKPTKGLTFAHM